MITVTPRRSPLAISVLNVQPDDVIGDVVLIKGSIDRLHVCLIPVVPATLVVGNAKVLGQRCGACQARILLHHLQMGTGRQLLTGCPRASKFAAC